MVHRFFKLAGLLSYLVMMGLVGLKAQLTINNELLSTFTYRNLGPFRPGGWVVDIAVPAGPAREHLYTIYVATRNGGLYKTINNGTTWASIFHQDEVHSLGAVEVSASHPDMVWLGTGDSYYARSSYAGNGVYKSIDGGKSWKYMGLLESHHIGKILIHPGNPDIVYVAAMGHLFTSNPERGLFKTTDGGRSWQHILKFNDTIGVVDMVMHPTKPDLIFVAAYEKVRHPWTLIEGGPGSGIYKTADGGKKWERLKNGLPSGPVGRIGLDISLSNPNIIYAVYENLNERAPFMEEIKLDSLRGLSPPKRVIGGEVYRSDDQGRSWRKTNRLEDNVGGKAAYSFNSLYVDPVNPDLVYVTGLNLQHTTDGGKSWYGIEWVDSTKLFNTAFGDVRTLWIDPKDPARLLMGSDGGLHISYDHGRTNDHYSNMPLGEIYALGVDMAQPYNIYVGMQDHDSWKGPVNGWSGQITLENWVPVGEGDGMYNQVDAESGRWVYNNYQFGGHIRLDQHTGERVNIEPRRPKGQTPYRWNWTAPIQLSPHNSSVVYTGAEVVLKSVDRGVHWQEISPDLTTNHPGKINGKGNIQFCTITTLSESPLQAEVIWVGTDDGQVWLTRNGGRHWENNTAAIQAAGGTAELWVSRVLASRHAPGTAYVTKNGFRQDHYRAYVFKTEDYGRTWTNLSAGLPDKPVNVVAEGVKNKRLLFTGHDQGVSISLDGGQHWYGFRQNMPTVPVHDLLVHPRELDLVVGTYGRGVWTTDVSVLEAWSDSLGADQLHIFPIEPKHARLEGVRGANYHLYGDRYIQVPNEFNGTVIHFISPPGIDSVTMTIVDHADQPVINRTIKTQAGLNTVQWDFRFAGTGRRAGPLVLPGRYKILLKSGPHQASAWAEYLGELGWNIDPQTRVVREEK